MHDALLAGICAQPEDITARLVYADYLLEQPEPAQRDRGEFILAQCRLSAGRLSPTEEGQLRAREKELLTKYRDAWLAPLAGLVSHAAFRCGFAERVTLSADQFTDSFAVVSRLTPVARLHITEPAGVIGELMQDAQFRDVVGLDLSRERISAHGLATVLGSEHLARLRYLNLGNNTFADTGAHILAESSVWGQLQFLGVTRCGITPSGVARLLSRVAAAPGLRWLNLRGNLLSPGAWAETVLNRLPPKMPAALRLSLEGQLGRFRLTKPQPDSGPLPRLKAASAKLSPDFAAWVKALDVSKPGQFVAAVGANPLPPEVHQAFAAVCVRRFEWVSRRLDAGTALDKLPAAVGPKGLADLVREILCATIHTPTEDALWLRDWLLRLFEQHAAGTLDPQGRTR